MSARKTKGNGARGRPSEYDADIALRICEQLSEGNSLRAICKADDMPPESTVRMWVIDDREGFAAHYTRARDLGLDCMADEVIDIADSATDDPANKRIRFDARRWYLSKLAPKRYGDKVTTEHTGPDGGPIRSEARLDVSTLTEEQLRVIASVPVIRG